MYKMMVKMGKTTKNLYPKVTVAYTTNQVWMFERNSPYKMFEWLMQRFSLE